MFLHSTSPLSIYLDRRSKEEDTKNSILLAIKLVDYFVPGKTTPEELYNYLLSLTNDPVLILKASLLFYQTAMDIAAERKKNGQTQSDKGNGDIRIGACESEGDAVQS